MANLFLNGRIYTPFLQKNSYTAEAKNCIEGTVKELLEIHTTTDRPGMLLGMIQSGKTRTFLGIIALSFDNGYDIAIVFTKGTIALAQQTYKRLEESFSDLINYDEVQVFDIMNLPNNLPDYVVSQKIIIVCKKEDDNLRRLEKAIFKTYPEMCKKRILIIDDEADYASIGFKMTRGEIAQINVIAGQIDKLRKMTTQYSYLQVTATPYSLYLQPSELEIRETNQIFKPVRPAFTELVPEFGGYIGGKDYFEEGIKEGSIASYFFNHVRPKEIVTLRKRDARRFKREQALTSRAIPALRSAIINFIVGACIRRLQDKQEAKRSRKYSFIVHTERKKSAHAWQEMIVTSIIEKMKELAKEDSPLLKNLLEESYNNLRMSIELLGVFLPPFEDVKLEVYNLLNSVMITEVNSNSDVRQLLDDTGQLQLRTPLNIFIGGQILDRGLTIGNLIGFFYGRSPARFQQDTVLQHSRMYGNRPISDLAVTRFYTSPLIYSVMKKIYDFDTALREAFKKGGHEAGVVFIQKDSRNQIIPCSPNKILLSSTTTLRPYKRLLPIGFQTGYKTNIKKKILEIDNILESMVHKYDNGNPFLMDLSIAKTILNKINLTLYFEDEGYKWDLLSYIASMEYVSNTTENKEQQGKIFCLVRKNRELSRIRQDGRFENSPDTPHEEGAIAKKFAIDIPCLMLFRQNGRKEKGWMDYPFWWPVLMMPKNMVTVVYTSEVENI